MADGLTTAIGEALPSFVQVAWPTAAPQVRRFAETVFEAVKPNPPFRLHCHDGQTATGLVILDHGRALLFVGTRQPAVTAPAYPTVRTPSVSMKRYLMRGPPPPSVDSLASSSPCPPPPPARGA